MNKIGKLLYEQVYLFFLRKDSNDIVISYIDIGLNLIFNSDSLLITKGNNSYIIKVVIRDEKKYWNICSNKNDFNYYLLCIEGNLDEVFEYINQL